LFLLFLMLPLAAQADELLIFVNNKEFLGDIIVRGDEVYLESKWLGRFLKEHKLELDTEDGDLKLDGEKITCIRGTGADRGKFFISGRALANSLGGRYRVEHDAGTVDIYTFGRRKIPITTPSPAGAAISAPTAPAIGKPFPPVAMRVIRSMQSLGMDISKYPINLIFEKGEIIRQKRGAEAAGYIRLALMGKKIVSCDVYIPIEQTEVEKIASIAHEFGHLWYEMNGGVFPDLFHKEGFAEWTAYKVLRYLEYHQAANLRLKNETPVYGDGLRYFVKLEDRFDSDRVLKYVQGKFTPLPE